MTSEKERTYDHIKCSSPELTRAWNRRSNKHLTQEGDRHRSDLLDPVLEGVVEEDELERLLGVRLLQVRLGHAVARVPVHGVLRAGHGAQRDAGLAGAVHVVGVRVKDGDGECGRAFGDEIRLALAGDELGKEPRARRLPGLFLAVHQF